jgi:rhamnogalacturonan endolyase
MKLFPRDVDFTVGKSDYRRDWFIYEVPHAVDDDDTGRGRGRATTWTIRFDMPAGTAAGGEAVLRMGLSGVSARSIDVGVNGKAAGTVTGLTYNATINRDGVQGSWVEKDVSFDTALLQAGQNVLTLTVPEGGLMSGVAYDVVRLEVADGK